MAKEKWGKKMGFGYDWGHEGLVVLLG